FFFQAEDGIRDKLVTGVQTCALPILREALADSPAIRELSANPLLLTMMAVLNRVQDLPRDRGRLYERCAELLLKNWDLEKFEERSEERRVGKECRSRWWR